MSTDRPTAAERRSRYQTLLCTIAYQTGDPQPVLCSARSLWTTLVAHGQLDCQDAQTAMRAARENGDVIRWEDSDGCVRYGVTESGIEAVDELDAPLYSKSDEPKLREILTTEVEKDEPNKSVIGWCNSRLGALE